MTTVSVPQAVQNSFVWGGLRVWQRNRDAFLRSWKVEVGGIAIEPFIMLVAIGFGLGAYVSEINGGTYAQFVAPGVIASYAMWHATFDATYGAYLRMSANHLYEAYLFTPVGARDIVAGEVMWSATRSVMSSTAVLVAAAIFGLVDSPLAVLAIPAAFLIGVMFASIAMLMTATAASIGSMNNFFTLFLLPMFYLGGVFFPLDRLPDTVQRISWVMPLTPATALMRGLVNGPVTPMMLLWTLELVAFTAVAFWLASMFMRRRLIK